MKESSCVDHSEVTCRSLASMSFSFRAEIQTSSISSLFGSRGASRISCNVNPGLSKSKVNDVIWKKSTYSELNISKIPINISAVYELKSIA